jgi:peptide/nickel transport system substrate-binding protein
MLRRVNGTRSRFNFFTSSLLPYFVASFCFASCSRPPRNDPSSLTFLIESSPTNLDPRFATDSQSQRLDGLLFNGLLDRDNQMNFHGDLAESWETPNPLTYVFHLRRGVRFHDGRPLTSANVKSTLDFIANPANKSPKRGALRLLTSVETPDAATVVVHLSAPYASFTVNLIATAIGIVPANAGADFSRHPIGSGPFRFVQQSQDEEVVLESNPGYFRDAPQIKRVRFRVVPDGVVRALELRKGSADLEMSSLSPDIIPVLARQPGLTVSDNTGTNLSYLGFNLEDPVLSHREVRQALALATDREALIRYLLDGQAKLAAGVLPPNHWAAETNVTPYPYDPARAEQLLETAGFARKQDGMRLRLTLNVPRKSKPALLARRFRNNGAAWAFSSNSGRWSSPRCSPTSPREIFRSPTSAGSAPTPIRTFLNMLSRRNEFRPTAPIADTIATRASTR